MASRVSRGGKAALPAEMADVEFDGFVARLTDRVFDNPAMSGGLFVMALTAAAIVSNAMFLQSTRHPQPLFMTRPAPDLAEAVPIPRSRADRTGSIPPVAAEPPLPRMQPAQRVATEPAAPVADRTVITDIQRALAERGLYKGAIDGISGSRTRAAITAFEKSAGLPVTGRPSAGVLDSIRSAAASPPKKAPVVAAAPAPAKLSTRVAAAPAAPIPPADIPVVTRAAAPAAAAPASIAAAAPPAPARTADPDDAIASMVDQPMPAIPAAASAPPSSGLDEAASVMTSAPVIEPAPVRTAAAPPAAEVAAPAPAPAVLAPAPDAAPASNPRYAAVQRALNDIGYGPVAESGLVDDATSDAIRRFELDNGLPLTGRPEDRVVNRLVSIGAMDAI